MLSIEIQLFGLRRTNNKKLFVSLPSQIEPVDPVSVTLEVVRWWWIGVLSIDVKQ